MKEQIRARDNAKKVASRTGSAEDWTNYRRKRNEANLAIKHAKIRFYRNSIANNTDNPKKTWSILNGLMGKKSENTEINEIIDSSNNVITESREIADQLNRHFSTIGPNLASKLHESEIDPREYLKQSESKFKLQKVGNKLMLKLLLKPGEFI